MAFRTECETGSCLAVRSTASGQVRELALPFTFFTEPSWSPDGKWVAVAARDYKGNSGIFRIDVESGETTKFAEGSHTARVLVSRDGRKLYAQAVEHDLATKATRTVYTPPEGARAGQYELSPDGRHFAVVQSPNPSRNAANSMANQSVVMLVPVDGSAPRELFRASQQERFELFPSCLTWTADGRALVAIKSIGERKELWLLPLEGQPRKLEIDISEWHDEGIRLSPDGKQIAFLSGDRGEEVWALESFLPKVGGGGLR
jgi:Tol biopolymer transport system component